MNPVSVSKVLLPSQRLCERTTDFIIYTKYTKEESILLTVNMLYVVCLMPVGKVYLTIWAYFLIRQMLCMKIFIYFCKNVVYPSDSWFYLHVEYGGQIQSRDVTRDTWSLPV